MFVKSCSILKTFIFKVDIYAYVSHFSKSHGIENKLHRLVPMERIALPCIWFLDWMHGLARIQGSVMLTHTHIWYVSLTHTCMCHVPNLVKLHGCLANKV